MRHKKNAAFCKPRGFAKQDPFSPSKTHRNSINQVHQYSLSMCEDLLTSNFPFIMGEINPNDFLSVDFCDDFFDFENDMSSLMHQGYSTEIDVFQAMFPLVQGNSLENSSVLATRKFSQVCNESPSVIKTERSSKLHRTESLNNSSSSNNSGFVNTYGHLSPQALGPVDPLLAPPPLQSSSETEEQVPSKSKIARHKKKCKGKTKVKNPKYALNSRNMQRMMREGLCKVVAAMKKVRSKHGLCFEIFKKTSPVSVDSAEFEMCLTSIEVFLSGVLCADSPIDLNGFDPKGKTSLSQELVFKSFGLNGTLRFHSLASFMMNPETHSQTSRVQSGCQAAFADLLHACTSFAPPHVSPLYLSAPTTTPTMATSAIPISVGKSNQKSAELFTSGVSECFSDSLPQFFRGRAVVARVATAFACAVSGWVESRGIELPPTDSGDPESRMRCRSKITIDRDSVFVSNVDRVMSARFTWTCRLKSAVSGVDSSNIVGNSVTEGTGCELLKLNGLIRCTLAIPIPTSASNRPMSDSILDPLASTTSSVYDSPRSTSSLCGGEGSISSGHGSDDSADIDLPLISKATISLDPYSLQRQVLAKRRI